jgi:KaiC domain protein
MSETGEDGDEDDGAEDWFERGRRRIREGADEGDRPADSDGADEPDRGRGPGGADEPDGEGESAGPSEPDGSEPGGDGDESGPGDADGDEFGPGSADGDGNGNGGEFGLGGVDAEPEPKSESETDSDPDPDPDSGAGPATDRFTSDSDDPLAADLSGDRPFDPEPGRGGANDDPFGFDDFGDAGGATDTGGPAGAGEFGLGGPGGAGGSGGPGGGAAAVDDEEFESEIPRVRIGIDGLDEMILGGVPDSSLLAVIGAAGTGKTTFGLQFLNEALREGEPAAYITLEESRDSILDSAEEKGMPFREYEAGGDLAVVAMDPIEMANSLSSIRSELPALVTGFGAERLVLDSVSLLEMMYDRAAKRRSEVFDFARALKNAGVTTLLTSEASPEDPYTSRYGIVEYLADAVFVLQYVRPSDFRETRLAVEIQKIRDANHSRETKPYEITEEGISVYQRANIF